MKFKNQMTAADSTGFTLIEILVALALMAVIIPVVVAALRVATLAGEVAQRKALAARIAERVLNEAIIANTTMTPQSGKESVGPYQFSWAIKDEPWSQLGSMVALNNPNSVNSQYVNQSQIHQVSSDVSFKVQNRDFSVHLSTLITVASQ